LADFQEHKAEFDALNAEIVALSADPEEEAWGTVERLGLKFRVVYGLDPEATTGGVHTRTRRQDRPCRVFEREDGAAHGRRCADDREGAS
jgi:hypothetical protein